MLGYGERLKELRFESNLTMEKAAQIVGVAKSTYAGYESEFRQPSLEKLALFAAHYEVSVDYILKLTDQRERIQEKTANVCDLLKKDEIHWDGVQLQEEDLKQIKEILTKIADKNKESQTQDPQKTRFRSS